MIEYLLLVTFLDTGATSSYHFDSESNCKAVIPAVQQLYAGLRQPVKLECRPRQASLSPANLKF